MKNNPVKILFLDFDGVLNTPDEAFNCTLNHELVQLVGLFCYQYDIKVVFSTAWRLFQVFNSADKLRSFLVDFGFPSEVECIDTTPDLSFMMPKGFNNYGENNLFPLRGYEIRNWLAKHPDVDAYVAIDDIGAQFFEDQFIVQTNDLIGVTKKNLEKINKLLNQQLKALEPPVGLLENFKHWMDKKEILDPNKEQDTSSGTGTNGGGNEINNPTTINNIMGEMKIVEQNLEFPRRLSFQDINKINLKIDLNKQSHQETHFDE